MATNADIKREKAATAQARECNFKKDCQKKKRT